MIGRKCQFGDHRALKTWCYHPEQSSRLPVLVRNQDCERCPLFNQTSSLRPASSMRCVHQGDVLERVECQSCGGSQVLHEVHQCDVHGSCVSSRLAFEKLREQGRKVKCCATCDSFHASPTLQHCGLSHEYTAPHVQAGSIRVGFLTPVLAIGGVERWLITLAKSTKGVTWMGTSVHEDGRVDARTLAEVQTLMPVTHNRVDLLANCDIVMTWAEDECLQLDEVSAKIVHVIHGSTDWTKKCAAANQERVDHYVAVSNTVTQCAPSGFPVTVIENAIDVSRLLPSKSGSELRDELNIPQSERVVCYVGRFSPEKNPLAAAEAARDLNCTAVYCSVGETNWIDQVRKVTSKMRVLAPERVADCFTLSDCFVHASDHESFGLTYVEAWHLGCPVVSYRLGVVPRAEQLAGCPLITDIKQHKSLGEAVLASQRFTNKDAARRIVEDHYMPAIQAARYEALFDDLIG